MNASDAIKYAAALVKERISWTGDEIGGSCCGYDHDIPLDALHDLPDDICRLAERFGDVNTYSDGRKVKTIAWIEDGVYTEQVWHPNACEDKIRAWRGHLPSDPGEPSAGVYEVEADPATQQIHVRMVRMVR